MTDVAKAAPRTPAPKTPADCASMADVRGEIDRIDAALIALLAERFAYVERVPGLKLKEGIPAAAPDRVAAVLAGVRAKGEAAGLDPEMLAAMWVPMIDWIIAHEEEVMARGG